MSPKLWDVFVQESNPLYLVGMGTNRIGTEYFTCRKVETGSVVCD